MKLTAESLYTRRYQVVDVATIVDSLYDSEQGGGGTRIPNQGLEGGGLAKGRKKKSDLANFDGESGR